MCRRCRVEENSVQLCCCCFTWVVVVGEGDCCTLIHALMDWNLHRRHDNHCSMSCCCWWRRLLHVHTCIDGLKSLQTVGWPFWCCVLQFLPANLDCAVFNLAFSTDLDPPKPGQIRRRLWWVQHPPPFVALVLRAHLLTISSDIHTGVATTNTRGERFKLCAVGDLAFTAMKALYLTPVASGTLVLQQSITHGCIFEKFALRQKQHIYMYRTSCVLAHACMGNVWVHNLSPS